jgi:hypothetical protein
MKKQKKFAEKQVKKDKNGAPEKYGLTKPAKTKRTPEQSVKPERIEYPDIE